jgi:hypothetical protein
LAAWNFSIKPYNPKNIPEQTGHKITNQHYKLK